MGGIFVPEIEELIKQIEELRLNMIKIKEGKTLTDPEVVAASQMLDAILNEYYKLLKQKVDGD
jgi:Spo0E like sporulation regulatory protein.